MLNKPACSIALALFAGLALPSGARAQEAFAGTWTVAKAEKAPWAQTSPPADSELRALMGKIVTFAPKKIEGPAPLRCTKLKYEIKSYTADMLFQGSLTDPDKQATTLGFTGSPIKTLETGCANELDFHMVDTDTVLFGLNDRVYTLTRKGR